MKSTDLDKFSSARIIEAGVTALSNILGIEDPQEASARLIELAPPQLDLSILDALIRHASEDATDDLVDLLRLLLTTEAEASAVCSAEVGRALDSAGKKQIVITPDLLYLAAALGVYCITMLSKPKGSETERITIEESPDGKKKITVDRKVIYLNPFSPLVTLLSKFLNIPGTTVGKE